MPEIRELLKGLANGAAYLSESSQSSTLVTPSGSDALPIVKDLKISESS